MRVGELAERLGGTLDGDPDVEITGVAGIREAARGDLTFLANPRYAAYTRDTRASAMLIASGNAGNHLDVAIPRILVDDPYQAFIAAARLFHPAPPPPPPGVHPTAVVGPGVELGEGVSVGPQAVIEGGARIGDRSIIGALVHVGRDSAIGRDSHLHPGVVVREDCRLGDRVIVHAGTVIGSDGFGFAWDGTCHRKIPQTGGVVVDDDVEIGAGCAIDRGTVGETRIGRGCRLDNLVHIGHNVQVGEHTLIIAQVGIGGSTRIGKHVTLAGQVGIVGHVEIGDGVQIGAQAGVISSIAAGTRVWGYPAMSLAQSKRVYASIKRTPELLRTVKSLTERIGDLEARLGITPAAAGASGGSQQPAPRRRRDDGETADD
ncbi:MAG: UDP-3-O-(3-hydroxymyristoyl)glucosamine N-acyltransferase [Candidatus Eiseniibacteriota bacterium]